MDRELTPSPDFAAMTDAERDAWVIAESLADVKDVHPDWRGVDAERMLARGYPIEGVTGEWTFDSWPATTPKRRDALRLARLFAADHAAFVRETGRSSLALAGQTGRSKTGLAVAMGWVMTGRGFAGGTADSTFVTWRELMRRCYDAIGSQGRAGAPGVGMPAGLGAIIREYAEAPVLILDDLGDPDAEKAPPFVRQVLQEIIWPRHDRRAPTVVTTNCREAALAAQFGDAAVSRLVGMAKWVALDGPDERRSMERAA